MITSIIPESSLIDSPDSPAVLRDQKESNDNAFIFAEQSGVSLTDGLDVDITDPGTYNRNTPPSPETIPNGTIIDSFFLHFDPEGRPNQRVEVSGSVTFDTEILGVIVTDTNLNDSDDLGASNTAYPTGLLDRGSVFGREQLDNITLSENTLEYNIGARQVIDQIRIITAAAPPVNNPPEIISLSVTPDTINENDMLTLTGTFIDSDSDDNHTIFIDWNDPNTSIVDTIQLSGGEREFTATYQYSDDGVAPGNGTEFDDYEIEVRVDDNSGATDTSSIAVRVQNVEPIITKLEAELVFIDDDDGIDNGDDDDEGVLITVTGTFTDPGSLDIHTRTAVWSDGVSVDVDEIGLGERTFTISRFLSEDELENNFPEIGDDVFQVGITTTIMDDDNGSAFFEESFEVPEEGEIG